MSFDIEKMNKLPVEARFFDVNEIWYFMNRWVVRLLYPTSVTPNQVTVLSLVFGLASAGFYVSGIPDALVWGAVFLYGKVFFDNVDGNLARVRGTTGAANGSEAFVALSSPKPLRLRSGQASSPRTGE